MNELAAGLFARKVAQVEQKNSGKFPLFTTQNLWQFVLHLSYYNNITLSYYCIQTLLCKNLAMRRAAFDSNVELHTTLCLRVVFKNVLPMYEI